MSGEGAKARVLYVEDDPDNRTVFQHAFSPKFVVETCASGEEALGHIRADDPPAAVVADQRMPGMTGLELLERVREVAPATKRILVSAYDDPEPRGHLDGCIQVYLQKPYDADELAAFIAAPPETYAELVLRAERMAAEVLGELDRVLEEDATRACRWRTAHAEEATGA